jgi:3-hydroxyacyl-[acyl-carrier-protein] dehydratase
MPLLDDFYVLKDLIQSDSTIKAKVEINSKHKVFDGHFPENPVVPGVCMMEMIKEILEISREDNYILSSATNIKFMNILNPFVHPEVEFVHEIVSENTEEIKLKSSILYEETVFLKFSGSFKKKTI